MASNKKTGLEELDDEEFERLILEALKEQEDENKRFVEDTRDFASISQKELLGMSIDKCIFSFFTKIWLHEDNVHSIKDLLEYAERQLPAIPDRIQFVILDIVCFCEAGGLDFGLLKSPGHLSSEKVENIARMPKRRLQSLPIEKLNLSMRTKFGLVQMGIKSVWQLCECMKSRLRYNPYLGSKASTEVADFLRELQANGLGLDLSALEAQPAVVSIESVARMTKRELQNLSVELLGLSPCAKLALLRFRMDTAWQFLCDFGYDRRAVPYRSGGELYAFLSGLEENGFNLSLEMLEDQPTANVENIADMSQRRLQALRIEALDLSLSTKWKLDAMGIYTLWQLLCVCTVGQLGATLIRLKEDGPDFWDFNPVLERDASDEVFGYIKKLLANGLAFANMAALQESLAKNAERVAMLVHDARDIGHSLTLGGRGSDYGPWGPWGSEYFDYLNLSSHARSALKRYCSNRPVISTLFKYSERDFYPNHRFGPKASAEVVAFIREAKRSAKDRLFH